MLFKYLSLIALISNKPVLVTNFNRRLNSWCLFHKNDPIRSIDRVPWSVTGTILLSLDARALASVSSRSFSTSCTQKRISGASDVHRATCNNANKYEPEKLLTFEEMNMFSHSSFFAKVNGALWELSIKLEILLSAYNFSTKVVSSICFHSILHSVELKSLFFSQLKSTDNRRHLRSKDNQVAHCLKSPEESLQSRQLILFDIIQLFNFAADALATPCKHKLRSTCVFFTVILLSNHLRNE